MKRFIHIPKNAGTSVVNWLKENNLEFCYGYGPKGIGIHRYASHFKDEDYEKFCIVRNPYSRVISYYNYLTAGEKWNYTFDQFVREKISNINTKIPNAWNLQINWIYENNISLIKKIIRYETVESEIQDYFKCYSPFPKLNISSFNGYENYYTEELKEIVYNHFEKDFKILGYKK